MITNKKITKFGNCMIKFHMFPPQNNYYALVYWLLRHNCVDMYVIMLLEVENIRLRENERVPKESFIR